MRSVQFFPRSSFFVIICALCTLLFALSGLIAAAAIMGFFTFAAASFWQYERVTRRLHQGPPPVVDAETLMKTVVNETLRRGEPVVGTVDDNGALHIQGRSSSGRPVIHLRRKGDGVEVYTTHPEFYADDPKWERVS